MEKQLSTPKLRFPEFVEKWEKKKLGDIANKVNSGKTPLGGESVYVEEGVLFIRSQNVLDSKLSFDNSTFITEIINDTMKNSVVKPNDILLNITGASLGRSCVVPQNFTIGNVNQHVCIVRINNQNEPRFIQPIFTSKKGQDIFASLQTGSGREGLNFQSIRGMALYFPSLTEQTKIANFLTAVDNKLTQIKKRKNLLKQYKKGVMQKLFSRQLRFKNENGNDFAEWEEKKLGEIAKFKKGKGVSKIDISENGKIECIRYGQLYTYYGEVITSVISRTNIEKKNLVLSEANDIIIPASGETQIDISTASCVMRSGIALGGDLNIIRTKNNGVFLSYYLNNKRKIEIANLAQGVSVVHLYASQLAQLKIDLPSIPEQTKIANFLSSLDEKINRCGMQIEKIECWKKGLLQKMFV